ncbi:DUF6441 family protein [Magnetococcales bacterium HHB-1]
MNIAASLSRNFKKAMEAEVRRIEQAAQEGIVEAGQGLKEELRKQVISAGLGRRVANTWRSREYKNQGFNPAALVWSKAPHIIKAFDKGALIKSQDGFWLAIPTENAPKRGVDRKRITPSNFPESRWGPLRFVYRKNGPSLLVVDSVRINKTGRVGRRAKGGAYTKTGRMKKGMTTAIMFILVPQVKMPKKLDVARAAEYWVRQLPRLIERQMEKP